MTHESECIGQQTERGVLLVEDRVDTNAPCMPLGLSICDKGLLWSARDRWGAGGSTVDSASL